LLLFFSLLSLSHQLKPLLSFSCAFCWFLVTNNNQKKKA
jgi:hypothetical protein